MESEITFRMALLGLTLTLYGARLWCKWRSPSSGRTQLSTRALFSITVMGIWAGSLLAYVSGVTWFDYHLLLPDFMRWTGAVFMVVSFPLMWMRMHDYMSSHISSGVAASHLDLEDALIFNPTYVTFVICAMGVVLLSANVYVLVTSSMALVAMALLVKRDSRNGSVYVAATQ